MAGNLLINKIMIDWSQIEETSWLHQIESIRNLDELELKAPVTFFAGENGSGKSTLLEAIAIAAGFNPEGGTRNYAFSTFDSHSPLHEAVRLSRGIRRIRNGYFLRAESFYNVATMEEEYSRGPGGRPKHYHMKSHGESFLAIAQDHFNADGLYFLDEPEAALSPQRQLTLLIEIAECVKRGAQFIIVTHSPILLGLPEAEILSFDEGRVHEISYEETDSYRVTSLFVNNRERLLKELLEDE